MLGRLRGLIVRSEAPVPGPAPTPPAPAEALAVIGDVHGRDDLLGRMLDRLAADHPGHRPIVVGDVIDRGDRSRAVLHRLSARTDVTTLMGNHELMLLEFIDRPETGGRWVRHGGIQTLASFGVGAGLTDRSPPERLSRARDDLVEAMGPDLVAWLRGLPGHVLSGSVAVVHAGADPARPVAEQSTERLAWGHADFGRSPRADGLWIVHGHVVVRDPVVTGGRIAVDTGAYATGRLSAALLDPAGGVSFLEERG